MAIPEVDKSLTKGFAGNSGERQEREWPHKEWWAWVDLNHRPRPYQGLLWCYMHSSVAMITLLTTSPTVTSWHDCWFQVARSVQSGDHFLQADMNVTYRMSRSGLLPICRHLSALCWRY